jgi:hypothetical protein
VSAAAKTRGPAQVSLAEESNPTHFFRERVVEAQARQHRKLPDNVEFYLVTLLCDFVKTRDDTAPDSDCLALVLKRALEGSYGEKIALFKHIGDTALYVSGFFRDSFNRKAYDMNYYAMMGGGAYSQLAALMRANSTFGRTMGTIYAELAEHFSPAVEVLMDVSDQTTGVADNHPFNALNVYSQWVSTESEKLGRDLLREGIIPVPMKRRHLQ